LSRDFRRPEDQAGLPLLYLLYVCVFWRREAEALEIGS
jgi:hypothetical protein